MNFFKEIPHRISWRSGTMFSRAY